jgi:large subunit ribosomal protein L24
MNRIKFHVKKGDEVEVISEIFRGSTGKSWRSFRRKQRVLVEGVRIIKKHLRKSQDNPSGKIAEREGPIHHFQRAIDRARRKRRKEEHEGKKAKEKR